MMISSISSTPSKSRTPLFESDDDDDEDSLLNYEGLRSPGSVKKAPTKQTPIVKNPKPPSPSPPPKPVESPQQIAERELNSLGDLLFSNYRGIQNPSQLYWQKRTIKNKKKVFPCRVCKPDEGRFLDLPQEWDEEKKVLVQFIGLHQKHKGDREVTRRSILVPFYGNNENHDQWCPDLMQQYQRQISKAKGKGSSEQEVVEELMCLERFLQHARDQEKKAEQEEAERIEEERRINEEEDDYDLEQEEREREAQRQQQQVDSDDESVDLGGLERKTEPLKAGDVIEYYNVIFRMGDKRGHRLATILSVDSKREVKLVLDNGEFLPDDHPVARKRFLYRGKLKDNENARYRAIEAYKLPKSGKDQSMAAGLQKEVKRVGAIVQKHTEVARKAATKDGFAPMDVLNTYKGPNQGENEEQDSDDEESGDSKKPAAKPRNQPTNSHAEWAKELEERLSKLTKGAGRRRSIKSHMTVQQLELALEVNRILEKKWKAEQDSGDCLQALAEELDISLRGLQTFLQGDSDKSVGKAQHQDTEQRLDEWKKSNKGSVSDSQPANKEEASSPAMVTQESDEENESDAADTVNTAMLPSKAQKAEAKLPKAKVAIQQQIETDKPENRKMEEISASAVDTKVASTVGSTSSAAKDAPTGGVDVKMASTATADRAESVKKAVKPAIGGAETKKRKIKSLSSAEPTRRKSKGAKRSMGDKPHSAENRPRHQQWAENIKQTLSKLAKSTGRRRSISMHMSQEQLELALEVIGLLENKCGTEVHAYRCGLEGLAEDIDVSLWALQKFLQGDDRSIVMKSQHSETERLLRDWKEAQTQSAPTSSPNKGEPFPENPLQIAPVDHENSDGAIDTNVSGSQASDEKEKIVEGTASEEQGSGVQGDHNEVGAVKRDDETAEPKQLSALINSDEERLQRDALETVQEDRNASIKEIESEKPETGDTANGRDERGIAVRNEEAAKAATEKGGTEKHSNLISKKNLESVTNAGAPASNSSQNGDAVSSPANDEDPASRPCPPSEEVIFKVDDDVVCGRGVWKNPGNLRYHELVKQEAQGYVAAKNKDKRCISRKIVNTVREKGGRFLQKDASSGTWRDVGDEKAQQKTSHSLRDRAAELRSHDRNAKLQKLPDGTTATVGVLTETENSTTDAMVEGCSERNVTGRGNGLSVGKVMEISSPKNVARRKSHVAKRKPDTTAQSPGKRLCQVDKENLSSTGANGTVEKPGKTASDIISDEKNVLNAPVVQPASVSTLTVNGGVEMIAAENATGVVKAIAEIAEKDIVAGDTVIAKQSAFGAMTDGQLKLAEQVKNAIQDVYESMGTSFEKAVDMVGLELNVHSEVLSMFLGGNEDGKVKKQHIDETETKLRTWLANNETLI